MAASPSKVTVNGQLAMKRLIDRGFTRSRAKLALLPYYPQLEEFLDQYVHHLELGIVTACLVHEYLPGLRNFLFFMDQYIHRCGLRFTKEQHLKLIKVTYLILTKENQWREIVTTAAKLLANLINGSRLTYKDMILDWLPVYDLYYGASYGKLQDLREVDLAPTVDKLKRFFDPKEIVHIWEKLQILISPRYKMDQFSDMCVHLLPVYMTGEEQRQYGAVHWWDTLWKLYTIVEQGGVDQLPSLFSSLARFAPDFMDLSPYYEDIFTRILRAMGLSMRKGKVLVGDMYSTISLASFAIWVGDLLGGPRSCQPQLGRLMKCMEAYLHPSNNGDHTGNILEFMKELADRMRERLYQERIKKHKRKIPSEYYLTDKDVGQFVSSMLQPTLVALFQPETEQSTVACNILQILAALDPGLVLPRYLEHTYAALHAVCEPHRLTHTLQCLVGVVYQLAADKQPNPQRQKIDNLGEEINRIRQLNTEKSRLLTGKEKTWLDANQSLLTLRHHLIHLLEALITAVDINDTYKTLLSLQNIVLIYYLIPNVDASDCVKYHSEMTEDEKELCKLTRKLPKLTDMLFDRLLKTIYSMAVCAPKNSVELLGSLNDGQTDTGEEEKQLLKMADKVVAVVLCNSSEPIASSLVEKIYNFITNNEFESKVAVTMASGLLQETVFSRPETLPRFAGFVFKNLKAILTPEMRKQKELNHTALWFVNLASSLFTTSSQAFIDNKSACLEIIQLLLDCECKFAHETGTTALWTSLFMLTRTYTRNEERVKKQLRRPLKEWIPIRDWARTYQEHELDLAWHVPDETRKAAAQEMIAKFVFPMLEKMSDAGTDLFCLRRCVNQLYTGFVGAYNCFPLPAAAKGPPVNPMPTVLPRGKIGPSGCPLVCWEIAHPSGRNFRELVVEACEKVIQRMDTGKKDDHQVLLTISSLLKYITSDTFIDQIQYKQVMKTCAEIFIHINNPIEYAKRITGDSLDAFVSALHFHTVCSEQSYSYAPFQQRIFSVLFKLAVNDYPEVRAQAQMDILQLAKDFVRARGDLVEMTVAVLKDEKSTDERLKGALTMIIANEWAAGCRDADRQKLWQALVEMKMMDLPELTESIEEIWKQIGNITVPERKKMAETGQLEDYCRLWWTEMKKDGQWTSLATEEQLEEARKTRKEQKDKKMREESILVKMLLEMNKNRHLHHTRQKLVRTMLWRCQRERAGPETIRILLAKMIDEEEYLRDRSADELAYWLRKNKPKTRRITWACPQRAASAPALMCGIREDNLCIAYDSQNLPDTEEKWNRTIFVSKQYGCYKWPKTLDVVAGDGTPAGRLDRGPLSEAEAAIVAWFEEPRNLNRWLEFLLIEKRDEKTVNETTCTMVKYVLRNFPGHPKILENLKTELSRLLRVKEREYQRLGAEIFIGIAKGSRHLPFGQLDPLWKWLAPEVDRLFDRLTSDAKRNWITAVATVLQKEDPRRFFRLIEQLIVGLQRPSSSAFHQAIRTDLISGMRWRDLEYRNRISEIVWRQLPGAKIEAQREAIALSLSQVCSQADANLLNDCSSVPERFRLKKLDLWLEAFERELHGLGGRLKPSKSAADLGTEKKIPVGLEKKAGSEPDLTGSVGETAAVVEKSRMIYMRTLLNFVLQYFDDRITCLRPGVIKLFPLIISYANEDESPDLHLLKDFDIQVIASTIIHEYMSTVLLTESFADEMLNTIVETYQAAITWKVRIAVLKFIQVLVFSNIYVCERKDRPEKMTNIIFSGLIDAQNEVRHEAARCLQVLTHFDYIKTNSSLVKRICDILSHKENHHYVHGAVLGLGSIVTAHPYTTPIEILPCIDHLCRVSSKNANIQLAATSALREFRRSHRDDWMKTIRILGTQLVYHIENAIAPVYYA